MLQGRPQNGRRAEGPRVRGLDLHHGLDKLHAAGLDQLQQTRLDIGLSGQSPGPELALQLLQHLEHGGHSLLHQRNLLQGLGVAAVAKENQAADHLQAQLPPLQAELHVGPLLALVRPPLKQHRMHHPVKCLRIRTPLLPDGREELLRYVRKVLLIRNQPLRAQLLQDVVQREEDAVVEDEVRALKEVEQVPEELRPRLRKVHARNLGDEDRQLDGHHLVVLMHQAQQPRAERRLLLFANARRVAALPPEPIDAVLEVHCRQPARTLAFPPARLVFDHVSQDGAEAGAALVAAQHLL
eukprot:scaffold2438_cov388-Prasinococcus_capsulatus_cf.AAC.2